MSDEQELLITLYTDTELSGDVLRRIEHATKAAGITLKKFDSVERTKKPWSTTAVKAAATLFEDDRSLFVTGDKQKFSIWFDQLLPGIFTWRITLMAAGAQCATWARWANELVSALPVIYGFVCARQDYDDRHHDLEPPRGISYQEFKQYLPGLYWHTIFGSMISKGAALADLDKGAVVVEKLPHKQIALTLSSPCFLKSYKQRHKDADAISDKILPGVVFHPKKKTGYRQIPELVKYIEKLAAAAAE